MDHADLVAEMAQVEHLSTQDRLHLARMRRSQQLKSAKQKDKELQKLHNRRERNANNANNNNNAGNNNNVNNSGKRHICFQDSVMLLEAAGRNDIAEVARLLQRGVTPDATNMDGLTALHQCCIDNNSEMLKLLLDYRANVNSQDSERWTPLHAAATCGHLNLVKILISRGANLLSVNADGNMPYDICDDEEALDYIEAEMSRRGVTQDLIDETRASTETRMLNDLQKLVADNGDIETVDQHGASPLHIASANGYIRVVEFLLEQHIAIDPVDNDLWTPVHAAACWGHMEILEMLAQSGADLNAKNKNDETPSDICEDPEIRERIEQLRTEQESKRLAEAQRKRVRRSQSNNTRAQSVRRTSLRDKTLTTKKDAVEETKLRLQAQEGYTTTDGSIPAGPTSISDNNNSASLVRPNSQTNQISTMNNINNNSNLNNNNNTHLIINNNNSKMQNPLYNNQSITNNNNNNNNNLNNNINSSSYAPYNVDPQQQQVSPPSSAATTAKQGQGNTFDSAATPMSRRSPEGKDNDSIISENNNNINRLSSSINNDQSIGTLADLKKHRSQTRSSTSPDNGSIITTQSVTSGSLNNGTCNYSASAALGSGKHLGEGMHPQLELSVAEFSQPPIASSITKIPKFTGNTSDVVSDSTKSRRCCIIM